MVSGIAQANAGINIGQLVRGNASTAAVKAWIFLGEKITRNLVAVIEEKGDW